jgi:tetratricopeptide (TPR) repeat protein
MLPSECSCLYDYSASGKLSYGDFLRLKQPEGTLRFGIDNQFKDRVATSLQLSEHGFTVLPANPEQGYTLLSQAMPAMEADLDDDAAAGGKLHWGCIDGLIAQSQINFQLDELVQQNKTAGSKWAYEQFEQGCAQFRQQLYKESFHSVSRAIDGTASDKGNKTEFRFHFLMGLIRLGSYRSTLPELVNPPLAQHGFLAAARHAAAAHPAEAGHAMICAGRAALVAGDLEDAIAHTRKGLSTLPSHAAGMYQLGRALFLRGTRREAAERLADAILLDVERALHAIGDPDFAAAKDFLDSVLQQALERYEVRYTQVSERYRRALKTLRDFSFMDVSIDDMRLRSVTASQEIPASAEAMGESKTLFAYNAAIHRLLEGFHLFPTCMEDFKGHCIRLVQQRVLHPPRREDYLPSNISDESLAEGKTSRTGVITGAVSGIGVFLFESSKIAGPVYRGILESMSELLLIPLGTAIGIAVTVSIVEDAYREFTRSKYKSALAAYDAARHGYNNLKRTQEKEIAEIQEMSLPKEFAPPAETGIVKPGSPDAAAAKKRGGAWAKL